MYVCDIEDKFLLSSGRYTDRNKLLEKHYSLVQGVCDKTYFRL